MVCEAAQRWSWLWTRVDAVARADTAARRIVFDGGGLARRHDGRIRAAALKIRRPHHYRDVVGEVRLLSRKRLGCLQINN